MQHQPVRNTLPLCGVKNEFLRIQNKKWSGYVSFIYVYDNISQ
jgi:hypothetical protein